MPKIWTRRIWLVQRPREGHMKLLRVFRATEGVGRGGMSTLSKLSKQQKALGNCNQNTQVPSPSTDTLLSLTSLVPLDCNRCVKDLLMLVEEDSWDTTRWKELLKTWLNFEQSYNSKVHLSLELATILQRLGAYEEYYWKWWTRLQPTWRHFEDRTPLRVVEGAWDYLDRPGKNGLASSDWQGYDKPPRLAGKGNAGAGQGRDNPTCDLFNKPRIIQNG
ncbi:hypothetical protein CVT26_009172 [Gymnopilus dilepis]|uniref:Uncharacterized protein n=1 Tax=Gymnopilus dilepis TaxID=231916 RepID=A0A409Y9G8_9AGAR|nr:hypothetical protein CVT26_009172 [Gymnopilus dilepis]